MFPGLTVKLLDKQFPPLQRRLGIGPEGRLYDLRHTAVTYAIAYAQATEGVSIADVARWAGAHRNSTTLDTYCHVLDSSPGLAGVMAARVPGRAGEAAVGRRGGRPGRVAFRVSVPVVGRPFPVARANIPVPDIAERVRVDGSALARETA